MTTRPWSEPKTHRSGVTAADGADPTLASQGIDTTGYERVRFDIVLNSGTPTYPVEVQVLFWNNRQGKYFRGAGLQITELPFAVEVETRGATVYLKVTALSGTAPNITIDQAMS